MKVYELMTALAEMPSGARVICSGTMTDNELHSSGVYDRTDENENLYSYSNEITDIDLEGKNIVYLQI